MENSKPLVIGAIIVAVLVIGFVLFQGSTKGGEEPPVGVTATPETMPLTVNAKHLYKDGEHTYRGIVETPTPCYDVAATAKATSDYNVYQIDITSKDRGGVCAQLITDKDFEVSFKAPVDAPVRATLNGKLVELNLLEVESREGLLGPFDFKS